MKAFELIFVVLISCATFRVDAQPTGELSKDVGAVEVHSTHQAVNSDKLNTGNQSSDVKQYPNTNVDSTQPQSYPTSCTSNDKTHCSAGKCLIKNILLGSQPFQVTCDDISDGGGWLVIQRRFKGTVDFYRDWTDYKNGFGNLDGEFWLGLDKIHALTTALLPVELLIQLKDHDDVIKYAKYQLFAIGNEAQLYELQAIDGYEGTAGDTFSIGKGYKFSTKDKDNAKLWFNRAVASKGGWWYGQLSTSNLNGRYYTLDNMHNPVNGINWESFHGFEYSMKFVQMMIRPRKSDSK